MNEVTRPYESITDIVRDYIALEDDVQEFGGDVTEVRHELTNVVAEMNGIEVIIEAFGELE